MKTVVAMPALLAGLMLAAPAGAGDKDLFGALLGGAGGAVLGAQIGKGHGRLASTAAGTLIGAAVGQSFGRSLDRADAVYAAGYRGHQPQVIYRQDYYTSSFGYGFGGNGYDRYGHGDRRGHYQQRYIYRHVTPPPVVYYQAPPVVYYQAPVRPTYVVAPPPVVAYRPAPGYCREYTAPIVIGGREVSGYGNACMRPDGSWELGPLTPEQ